MLATFKRDRTGQEVWLNQRAERAPFALRHGRSVWFLTGADLASIFGPEARAALAALERLRAERN